MLEAEHGASSALTSRLVTLSRRLGASGGWLPAPSWDMRGPDPVVEGGVAHIMSVDSQAFRTTLGHFASGIAVAATRDPQGKPLGVTVNSVTSVSLDPPLVLFCLERAAKSHEIFTTSGGSRETD